MIETLMPTRTFAPADYAPAPKKTLDRPSTMQDVADFVVDYINSDVGISRSNAGPVHLLIL